MEVGDHARRTACRVVGCEVDSNDRTVFCDRHWQIVHEGLSDTLLKVLKDAAWGYVGRSSYPERRLLEHRYRLRRKSADVRLPKDVFFDHMAVLYWSGDSNEIAFLEEALIGVLRKSGRTWKGLNRDETSRGSWSGDWNCLYVAWQRKGRATGSFDWVFRDVEHLDAGHRLWPTVGHPFPAPVLLKTSLTDKEAKKERDDYYAQRKAERKAIQDAWKQGAEPE